MCVEFVFLVQSNSIQQNYENIEFISKKSADVVIVTTSGKTVFEVFKEFSYNMTLTTGKTWIFTSASLYEEGFPLFAYINMLNGSLRFSLTTYTIPALQDYMTKASPYVYPNDPYIASIWGFLFGCHASQMLQNTLDDQLYYCREKSDGVESKCICSGNETLASINTFQFFAFTFLCNIYKAVYILAYGLHELFFKSTDNDHLKRNLNIGKPPRSVCSESCSPGYRKAPRNVQFTCCYDCVRCSEGHISNTTDMETCILCSKEKWSNNNRTVCIQRTIEFLSYQDSLGQSLATLSLVSLCTAYSVLLIFVKHHKTPVVKANNQTLSYILLFSLTLSFLCCFLFIGHPEKVTCLLRQVTFGINFTISVSCVLAKSVTVVIAFNATKPGSKIKKWVGTRVSICLVLLCTLVQVVICLVWLISSPPFPNYDTHTYPGKMILQCNEGSVPLFYTVIGYMGFLSALSFIVAFLVRKLPASFNEAQLITFSMLVFCSVWVSFIPAYLSTKGKYMVAVEIFAILASSAGLLGCIFIPKCYIILFHPEQNTRRHITEKM